MFTLTIIFTPWEFFTSVLADGLSLETEWQQISMTLNSILANLRNVVIWIASARPLISKSSSLFTNPLVTVPRAPITISTTVTFLFHSFLIPKHGRGTYPSFHFLSILFYRQWDRKVHNSAISLFLLITIRSDRLADIRWYFCISKYPRNLCVSFSKTNSGLCIYHLFV